MLTSSAETVTVAPATSTAPVASNLTNLFARVAASGSSIEIESESVIGLRIDCENARSVCSPANHSSSKSLFTSEAKKSPEFV